MRTVTHGLWFVQRHSAEIIIRAREALGETNRIRELTSVEQIPRAQRGAFAEKIESRASPATAHADDTNFGLAVRRLCCDGVRFNLETWLEGLRGHDQWKNDLQHAKAMKSKDSHSTCVGEQKVRSGVLSRNVRIVFVLFEEKSVYFWGDACVNCLLDHATRIVASAIPHGPQEVPSETAAG